MGCAEVIACDEVRARKQWSTLRHQLHERFDQWLDTLEHVWHEPPAKVSEMTATVWDLRQQRTGGITETIVAHAHEGERQRTQARCPRCPRVLKVQAHGRDDGGAGGARASLLFLSLLSCRSLPP
jgi:hypothetical protein